MKLINRSFGQQPGPSVAILVVAILAGLAGVIVARRLAVPVIELTGTASRIADGELELQATVSGTQEIATLAMAFNTMTAQLRELIGSLEQRVADRTKALATSGKSAAGSLPSWMKDNWSMKSWCKSDQRSTIIMPIFTCLMIRKNI